MEEEKEEEEEKREVNQIKSSLVVLVLVELLVVLGRRVPIIVHYSPFFGFLAYLNMENSARYEIFGRKGDGKSQSGVLRVRVKT